MFASIQHRFGKAASNVALPFLFLVLAGTVLVPYSAAQDFVSSSAPQSMTPIMLFDGTSTNGWAKANGKPHPGWVIEDGALFRKAGGGDLYHESTFRDFVLHFEWKISKGGNSGLKYRVRKYGNRSLGCEYQVLDDINNKREKNKTAGLYDVYSPSSNKPVVQPDMWQYSKIVVCGNRIEHWLNGVIVVQANVGSEDWNQHVADSKFRDNDQFGQNREGRIFLQDHGNPVWYRNIVLVPLNCDSATVVESDFPPSINKSYMIGAETSVLQSLPTVEMVVTEPNFDQVSRACPHQFVFQPPSARPLSFRRSLGRCLPFGNCGPRCQRFLTRH